MCFSVYRFISNRSVITEVISLFVLDIVWLNILNMNQISLKFWLSGRDERLHVFILQHLGNMLLYALELYMCRL